MAQEITGREVSTFGVLENSELLDAIIPVKAPDNLPHRTTPRAILAKASRVTIGNTFPADTHFIKPGDIHLFLEDVNNGLTLKDRDGTTDITSANAFDMIIWTGTDWQKLTNLLNESIYAGEYADNKAISGARFVSYNNQLYWTILDIPSNNTDDPETNPNFIRLSNNKDLLLRRSRITSGNAFPTKDVIPNDFHIFFEDVDSGLEWEDTDDLTELTSAKALDLAIYTAGGHWRKVTNLLKGNRNLGIWVVASGGAISGRIVYISDTRIDISYTNIANEDKSNEINAIQAGSGLVFGGGKIFVAEWFNNNAGYRSINGFWVNNDPDTTPVDSQTSIKVIETNLLAIQFITETQLKKKLPEVQIAYEKTVDIHLHETPGEFANMNDATIAGISLILKTTENDAALQSGTFDMASLTWETTSVDIPDDSNRYYVMARIAKDQGRIETQFRVINDSNSEPTEYLRGSIQDDPDWRYYRVVSDYNNVWTLQRRPPATHTRWDAPLGDIAIAQVQALIPEVEGKGLTPQQKAQFDSLVAKTADLLLETRETWAAATDASFLALPADNPQLARVRAGNTPQGLTGWANDVTTTEPRVILLRVPLNAQLADYRILLGEDNAVRLDSFGLNATGTQYAYMTSTSLSLQEASRIRLQHHGSTAHTRFIGMLADAIMERLVPDFSSEPNGSFLRLVSSALAWDAAADFLTRVDFEHRRNHTPNRVIHLPVRLEPQEQMILVSDGHWSDKYYRFALATHDVIISGEEHTYMGANSLAFSTDLPVFGNTGLPDIFRADRVAAIYGRTKDGSDEFNLKIILDKALIPLIPDPDDLTNTRMIPDFAGLRLGFKDSNRVINRTDPLTQPTFFSDEAGQSVSENEMTVGGKTYVALTPFAPVGERTYRYTQFLDNLLSNNPNASADFHISYVDSRTPTAVETATYLSDDLSDAWADTDEYPAGLYEGDINGHPIRAALPPLDTWNHVVARSNTYFSGTGPDVAAGVNGQFWANLRNGQVHQKQSGSWVLITDLALQTEISRATKWTDIPNNTQIPNNFITKHGNAYYGSLTQHIKTSTSSNPASDTTNWISLS